MAAALPNVGKGAKYGDLKRRLIFLLGAQQEDQATLEVAVLRAFSDVGERGGHQALGAAFGACSALGAAFTASSSAGSAFFAFFFFSFFTGAGFSVYSTLPPAASIAARAPLDALTSFSVILRESSP